MDNENSDNEITPELESKMKHQFVEDMVEKIQELDSEPSKLITDPYIKKHRRHVITDIIIGLTLTGLLSMWVLNYL